MQFILSLVGFALAMVLMLIFSNWLEEKYPKLAFKLNQLAYIGMDVCIYGGSILAFILFIWALIERNAAQ